MTDTSTAPDPTTTFGASLADHMVSLRWTADAGWSAARLGPLTDLRLSPAAMVLHYGQAIFEGMKAYRGEDDAVRLFRPEVNAARLQASARRMAMPELPVADFVAAVELLTAACADLVPAGPGRSLYLRPFMIATEAALGTRPAREHAFHVIGSPAGPYFASEYDGIRVWVEEHQPRAFPGGTGAAKCAGNYAGGMLVQQAATARGCQQVLYLDAREGRHLEELGGMNVVVVLDEPDGTTLVTPSTSDTILAGVTRDSILTLARDLGARVEERQVSFAEVEAGARSGRVSELFACGTAAVVTPVAELVRTGGSVRIGDGTPGRWTTALRDDLLGIQEGRRPDRYGWTRVVR